MEKIFSVKITNPIGLKANVAVSFVTLMNTFPTLSIQMEYSGKKVNSKSILGVLCLSASYNEDVIIYADGDVDDIELLSDILNKLSKSGFSEDAYHEVRTEINC